MSTKARSQVQRTMRKAFGIAVAVPLALTGLVFAPNAAAASPEMKPIDCSVPKVFVAQGEDATQLFVKSYDAAYGAATAGAAFTAMGDSWTGNGFIPRYNAIAYNNVDHFIYGLTDRPDGGVDLVKVGDQGVVEVIGEVKGVPQDHSFRNNGAFIDSTYYFASVTADAIYKLDLNSLEATKMSISKTWEADDFVEAYGYLWGLNYDWMFRLDPLDGSVVKFNVGKVIGGSLYGAGGAVFRYANGDFGVVSSAEQVETQIQITNPHSDMPTFTRIAQVAAPSSQRNDGTSCTDYTKVGLPSISISSMQTDEFPSWAPAETGSATDVVYKVVNTGTVALSGVSVDPTAVQVGGMALRGRFSAVHCDSSELAPGAATTCTATFSLAASDVELGRMSLGGAATGTYAGASVSSEPTSTVIYWRVNRPEAE